MIIRNIKHYLAKANSTVRDSMLRLEGTEEKTLIIVDNSNRLVGVLTDGDIRRWLLKNKSPSMDSLVSEVCFKNPRYRYESDLPLLHANQLYKIFPILDSDNVVVGVEKAAANRISIGDFTIGDEFPVFIIAEIGNNHNGQIALAMQMIDQAIEAGANCVKFQMRNLSEVYRSKTLSRKGDDLGVEYVVDILERFELSIEDHKKIFDYCTSRKVLYLCTPWDYKSLEVLESFGVAGYKVASADLTNRPLISKIIKTGKPIILSTGMSTRSEIQSAIDFLNAGGAQFALLHCNSTYPAPPQDINLNWLSELKRIHPIIGYSGHERGIEISLAAIALGACILERHFTLDRSMEGPDHLASLEFDEFQRLVRGVRTIELALGDGSRKELSQGEIMNRENLAKSLVASRALKAGTKIESHHLKIRSPGQGLNPLFYDELIGKIIKRDMEEEDFFFPSDLTDVQIHPGNYSFKASWGIPVRFHDINRLTSLINPRLYEFHLSYDDLDADVSKFLIRNYDGDLVVHAPELFAESHILDLASSDEEYRRHSLDEMQRVIRFTKSLREYFPNSQLPKIIVNVGGFSLDNQMDEEARHHAYSLFEDSMSRLDLSSVEFLPQSMPPFPWHFGGQRFHNLFVTAADIKHWCEHLNLKICLDTSHSFLACKHLGFDFYDFISEVAPYTSHIHLADAKGLNGEGLQIHHGEIDFVRLHSSLGNESKYSFIPEIWQGHKNNGEGFWIGLNTLSKLNLY